MSQQIIVTGADGMLGRAVVKAALAQNLEVVELNHAALDISHPAQVSKVLGEYGRPLVINCAGVVPPLASQGGVTDEVAIQMWHTNAFGPANLLFFAHRLVHISTDCVFDGAILEGAYDEAAQTSPLGHYAATKLAGEIAKAPHLTIRGSFIGLGRHGLVRWILDQPKGATIPGYVDWAWNGSYVGDFADEVVRLALDEALTGLLHLPGPEVLPKDELVRGVAKVLRPDLTVEAQDGGHRRMVLATRRIGPVRPARPMIQRLTDDYRNDPGRA